MIETLLLVLVAFQIKHWFVDFVNQTDDEVKHKGIYLHWQGMFHSVKHGVGTFFILFPFLDLTSVALLAAFDFLTHYHIDWVKMKFGNRNIETKAFWVQLGLDQFAHQITYLIITYNMVQQWLNT